MCSFHSNITHFSTAAAYIRVSTEDQLEYSPDSQLKRIREYTEHHDLYLPDEYIYLDEGISGRNADNRPAFMNMIRTAKQKPHPFDVILVWKYSRFARNRQDSIFYKSMLRKDCGINVISITEQLSDDPTSILIEALLEAMDEYYSVNLAQEVRRGMNEKFSRGGIVGPPPFGYRISNGVMEPDPDTAPAVSLIYECFLNGLSCRQIAEQLNHRQIHTIRNNLFESRTVRYILSNPFYLGMQRRHLSPSSEGTPMTVLPSQHPALITPEVFTQVQRLLRSSGQLHDNTATPSSYMLKGLVTCSSCGGHLTRSHGYLQCCRYTKGQCKDSHCVSLAFLTDLVLRMLEEDISLYLLSGTVGSGESKKSRETFPALSQLSKLLRSTQIAEYIKNQLLRSIIHHIRFSRMENTFQIFYRI